MLMMISHYVVIEKLVIKPDI